MAEPTPLSTPTPVPESAEEGAKTKRLVTGVLASNIFSLFCGCLFAYLSTSGLVHMSTARVILCFSWVIGSVGIVASEVVWGTKLKHKISICIGSVLLLGAWLYGLDAWTVRHLPPKNADPVMQKLGLLEQRLDASVVDEPRPGNSYHLLLKLTPQTTDGRHYIFDSGEPASSRVSLYLHDKTLVFSIIDGKERAFSVSAPLGPDGVPINQPLYLVASCGLITGGTIMSIQVDNRTVSEDRFDKQVDLGFLGKYPGIIGSDINKANGVSMELYALATYPRTLSKTETQGNLNYFKAKVAQRHIK